jgi:hypothetical protein
MICKVKSDASVKRAFDNSHKYANIHKKATSMNIAQDTAMSFKFKKAASIIE